MASQPFNAQPAAPAYNPQAVQPQPQVPHVVMVYNQQPPVQPNAAHHVDKPAVEVDVPFSEASTRQTISAGIAQTMGIVQALVNLIVICVFVAQYGFLNIATGLELAVFQIGCFIIGMMGFSTQNPLKIKFFAVMSLLVSVCTGIVLDEFSWLFAFFGFFVGLRDRLGVLRFVGLLVTIFGVVAFSFVYRFAKTIQRDGELARNTSFPDVTVDSAVTPPEQIPGTCCFCCNIEIGARILVVLNGFFSFLALSISAFYGLNAYFGGEAMVMFIMTYFGYRGTAHRLVSDMTIFMWASVIDTVASSLGFLVFGARSVSIAVAVFMAVIILGLNAYFCYVLYQFAKLLKENGHSDTAFQNYEVESINNPWAKF